MRKHRQKKAEFFLDGWTVIPPFGQVSIGEGSADPQPFHRTMRETRGWYLGRGLEIEDQLVRLTLAEEFATLDPSIHAEVSNRAAALRRMDVPLAVKIEDAKPKIRASLSELEAASLIQDLAEHRRIRNMMAHQPSWLESVWDPTALHPTGSSDLPAGRTVDYILWIGDDDFIWSIDQAQIHEWAAMIDRCCLGLDRAVQAYLA